MTPKRGKGAELANKGGAARGKYLTTETCGLGLFWSWCYCLWFVPDVYAGIGANLPGKEHAWLAVLGSAAVVQFLVPIFFRRRSLSSFPRLYVFVPLVMFAGTVGIELSYSVFPSVALYYFSSTLAGVSSAFMWHQWGERYMATKNAKVGAVAFAFGVVLSALLSTTFVLPTVLSDICVALIPLVSSYLLSCSLKTHPAVVPAALLPKASRKIGFGAMAKVSCIAFIVCAVCTFSWASSPVLQQNMGRDLLCAGILVGAFLMVAAALPSLLFGSELPAGRLLSWTCMLAVVALAMRASNIAALLPLSFVLSMAASVALDVLLVSYFVSLVVKGYTASTTAFGFSEGFICAAMVAGNFACKAVFGQSDGEIAAFPVELGLGLLCVLALMLLLLGDQQREINLIMTSPPEASEMERNSKAIADEFGLSAREYEILVLLGQGYTTQSVARSLVLSPYTVQTHIKHIYAKTGIHRRSELMDYVNLKRTTYHE